MFFFFYFPFLAYCSPHQVTTDSINYSPNCSSWCPPAPMNSRGEGAPAAEGTSNKFRYNKGKLFAHFTCFVFVNMDKHKVNETKQAAIHITHPHHPLSSPNTGTDPLTSACVSLSIDHGFNKIKWRRCPF